MGLMLLAALLAAGTAPAALAAEAAKPGVQAVTESDRPAQQGKPVADALDMKQLMAMFDKIFPPQPDPPAALLALSRATAEGVFPAGTYARLFDEMMSGMVDKVLAMRPSDLEPAGKAGAKGRPASTSSLREELVKEDPHFEERMRIMRRVVGEELVKVSAIMEPKLRDGLARSIARRFDERQLGDINAFLSTDSGKAFGSQSMRMWVDPDVMRSMFTALPDMIAAMPGAFERLEKETAHLPKPKPKQKAEEKAKSGQPKG